MGRRENQDYPHISMQYKNTKFNTKANEINENWQGQEQSSEI